jgi:hypothetical protein
MVKEVKIAGTWRESEATRKFWSKRKITKEQAEELFAKKDFKRFSQDKNQLSI